MNARRVFSVLGLSFLCLAAASPAFGLANRVFVSARSGNDANSCDDVNTPCQTFAGAVGQLNPDGEAIVLDSGGYGPVTITQGVTIEAPAGVTAFIHPPSLGHAIIINAGASDTVTLRGLTLKLGNQGGVTVNTVGMLNIENCAITGFSVGIAMLSPGRLNMKGTLVQGCLHGVVILISTGSVVASVDHCHLDGNGMGYEAVTISPGGSTTTATYSTANGNFNGWVCGDGSSGKDVINLEFCSGSDNFASGLSGASTNALSVARYSNCVLANNGTFGVARLNSGTFESRGNNTITGNVSGPTFGTIGTFPPM